VIRESIRIDDMDELSECDPSVEELSTSQCWKYLRATELGRLCVVTADGPDVFPINFLVDGGTLVFRSDSGTKLAAIDADPRVAFEIDGSDTSIDQAWSVVVHGKARRVVNDREGVDAVEPGVTPWQSGEKSCWIRIVPAEITGRRFPKAQVRDWELTTPIQTRRSPIE
jgi:nitroimidazol reductase NimA-like FMN-containing flavoprotein (pyridoxamine 5'-phosphate oxidase superfamily)